MGILFRNSFESSHFATPRYPDKMSGLMLENFWANKAACDDAERAYYEKLSGCKLAETDAPVAKEGGSASEEELVKNPGAFKNAANGERTFIMCKPDTVQ